MQDRILYYLSPIFKSLLFILFMFLWILPILYIGEFEVIKQIKNELFTNLVGEIGACIVVIGALLMIFQTLTNYNFSQVFIVKKHAFSGFIKGSVIGFLLIVACVGLALLNNNVVLAPGKPDPIIVLGYFAFYIFVAVFEEFFFRTFPLLVFAERYPLILTMIIVNALFGLAHIGNDGFNWLAMVNITLAGILFSIFTLQKWNISWAIGIHFGWNFTQGTILGYKVSGINSPGVFTAKPIGETYFSGGKFGIESSVFCTLVMLIVIAFLLYKYKLQPVKDVYLQNLEEETLV